MAAFTTYLRGDVVASRAGANAAGAPAHAVIEAFFDASQRNLAAADTMVLASIKAGTVVRAVYVEVVTIDATQTIDIGDATDPNGWVADGSVATAAYLAGAGAYASAPKVYAADTDLLLTVPSTKALDTAKIRVIIDAVLLG